MVHLYSHNDLDGVGCGILAKCAFGGQAEVRYNSVDGLNGQVARYLDRFADKPHDDQMLFITDLSVNPEIEQRITSYVEQGGKVKLIDHHKTALRLNEHSWGSVTVAYDDGRLASATSLFYEYLIQHRLIVPTKALDEFVELVRLYDTWEWERTDATMAKRLNDLFFLLSIDDFEETMIPRLKKNEPFAYTEFEEKILSMEDEKIDRYLRRKRRELIQTFIGDDCVGIVHAESYHSELGNELGKENPHLDYIAILNMGGKRISFRTIHDEIDVSAIAGKFGGGGHAKAAGSVLTEEAYELYVAAAFPLEPLRADAFRNQYNVKGSRYGTLYENRNDEKLLIYPENDEQWRIKWNGMLLTGAYTSFEEAERFVKRNHAAALVRDDVFVKYLMEQHTFVRR